MQQSFHLSFLVFTQLQYYTFVLNLDHLHKSEPSSWVLHCWGLLTTNELGLQIRTAPFSLCLHSGGSEPPEGGGAAVQLHSSQLLRVPEGGAEENWHHLLATVPAGETLWGKLCLLSTELQWVPMCANKSHQKIPWGMCYFYICMFGNTESKLKSLFLIKWMHQY